MSDPREAATEEAFRTAAASATTLHVTGPFRLNAASPLFSPLLLTPPAEASEPPDASANGIFEVREVPTAGVTARTLVVSDPAALTMRDAAAAVATLSWVWRAGGTDTLLVRRWTSDPTATNALLAEFYKALRDGSTPVDALQAARAALRKAAPDTPPSVWAGWLVLSGR